MVHGLVIDISLEGFLTRKLAQSSIDFCHGRAPDKIIRLYKDKLLHRSVYFAPTSSIQALDYYTEWHEVKFKLVAS